MACPVIAPNRESGITLVTNSTKPIFSPESTPGILLASRVDDVDVHAGAGFEDVGDDQADQHRHQRQDEEVAQRLDADAAGFAQAVHGGDAEGDDAEHHGDDDHLDQGDEPVIERGQRLTDVGQQEADGDAEDGAEDDLEPELADQGAESRSPLWRIGVVMVEVA